jgi:hypothetical protein
MIETLPLLTPDADRGERTRARCHEQLAQRRQRLEPSPKRANTSYLLVERALIGVLCTMYISGVALIAIQMLSGG